MHGVVVFYYKFTPSIGRGEVRFALTGQRCIECQNHQFETPMWYPEEAQKVMTNLFYQIASNIYKLKTPPPIKDRRLGRPLKKHVASNCQGCDLGLCKPPATLNSEQSKASPNKGNNNAANISNDRS
ncbi:Receptor-transporting protein 3 [Armadillidium vulgare]|nr:Receptor-transporting protein 3 [Armadillidium vulgare]